MRETVVTIMDDPSAGRKKIYVCRGNIAAWDYLPSEPMPVYMDEDWSGFFGPIKNLLFGKKRVRMPTGHQDYTNRVIERLIKKIMDAEREATTKRQ